MKLTKSKLKQIIKEELGIVLGDEGFDAEEAFKQLHGKEDLRQNEIKYLKGSSNQDEFDKRVEQIWEPPEEDF